VEPVTSGTYVGAGSFRCRSCGYVLTVNGSETLGKCPSCAGRDFERASLFTPEAIAEAQDIAAHDERPGPAPDTPSQEQPTEPTATQETARHGGLLAEPAPPDRAEQLIRAREQLTQPGGYLCYEDSGELRTVALTREWTRIGRSLAADLRFDDPTVSRRHALIVRQPDGVRVLDDRSMNGVFVNGERIEGTMLADGDEIIVGRYRLSYIDVSASELSTGPADPDALQSAD
jgi:predicted  nucleic acid-binding Zn-ribbon protein